MSNVSDRKDQVFQIIPASNVFAVYSMGDGTVSNGPVIREVVAYQVRKDGGDGNVYIEPVLSSPEFGVTGSDLYDTDMLGFVNLNLPIQCYLFCEKLTEAYKLLRDHRLKYSL